MSQLTLQLLLEVLQLLESPTSSSVEKVTSWPKRCAPPIYLAQEEEVVHRAKLALVSLLNASRPNLHFLLV
jgi:hypothetical protein